MATENSQNQNEKHQRRFYTEEFKRQMVNLYKAGHRRVDLIREYELSSSALDNWIAQDRNSGSFKAGDNRSPEENELIRLTKENRQLKMENDILKQAALILGRKENQR